MDSRARITYRAVDIGGEHFTMLMPWNSKTRSKELKAFVDADIKTIASLTSRILSVCRRDVQMNNVTAAFSTYFESKKHMTEKEVIDEIVPVVNRLISDASKIMSKVDVVPLPVAQTESHSYTRLQVAVLVTHMWLGAFTGYGYDKGLMEDIDAYQEPSLVGMYKTSNVFPLACILAYLRYVGQNIDNKDWCNQRVIYRRYMHQGEFAPLDTVDAQIGELYISGDNVDNTKCALQIIAANDVVGGDVFSKSCTQEEVTMLVRPECLVLLLIAPHPTPDGRGINCVIGAEKISGYGGFGPSVHYEGADSDNPLMVQTNEGTLISQVALAFVQMTPVHTVDRQYRHMFETDVYRLVVGFSSVPLPLEGSVIAAGDMTYKFITPPRELRVIQASIAAAITGKIYACCTQYKDLQGHVEQYSDWVNGRCVKEVVKTYAVEINDAWKRQGHDLDPQVLCMLVST